MVLAVALLVALYLLYKKSSPIGTGTGTGTTKGKGGKETGTGLTQTGTGTAVATTTGTQTSTITGTGDIKINKLVYDLLPADQKKYVDGLVATVNGLIHQYNYLPAAWKTGAVGIGMNTLISNIMFELKNYGVIQ